MGMLSHDPKSRFVALALDKPALYGCVCVYLSHPDADLLSRRFLNTCWSMDEVVAKEENGSGNLLKLRIDDHWPGNMNGYKSPMTPRQESSGVVI